MIQHKSITFIIVFFSLLCGCSEKKHTERTTEYHVTEVWPVFRSDFNLSGVTDAQLPDTMKSLWSFKTGGPVISSPVIGFRTVYIGSTDGKVYAIGLRDGKKTWEFDTGDDIEASPMLLDQTIYIGNLRGNFFALDAQTGRARWTYKIDGDIMGSANWVNVPGSPKNLVLVGSYDTKMYCFESDTGNLKWTYETNYYINGAPATDGHNVVFGGCDEQLHILSAMDGTKKGEVWAGSYIAGSAALVDNRAYVGHYGGKLVCIDVVDRKIVWEYGDKEGGSEFFSSPAVGKDKVLIGSRDNFLHCVDRKTGQMIWKFQTRGEVDSSPVIVNDKVVFGSSDGRFYMVTLEDGKEVWSYEIGSSITGSPAVIDGMIVIGAEDGRVYAFGDGT
ncbi:MAG: PQQ-binding-like beta-propeller repeat protein [Candidatus Latescibacteria bacterium]|nr:PQQ-binding-like beta-propeller repeat protein [Candidatus Latescibacterota bacterium]